MTKTYNHRIRTIELAEGWVSIAKGQPGRWIKTDRPTGGGTYHLFQRLGLEVKRSGDDMYIRWTPETLFVDTDPIPAAAISRPTVPVPAVTEIRGFLRNILDASGANVEHIGADVWLVRWQA